MGPITMTDFKTWLESTNHYLANSYRQSLKIVLVTAGDYLPTSEHRAIVERVMRSIPVPKMPKYPGEVSEEDKEWFKQQKRVDFTSILNDFINDLTPPGSDTGE